MPQATIGQPCVGLANFFTHYGFQKIIELDWHNNHTLDNLQITALPAVHWSKRGLHDENKTLWCSFALQTPKTNLYFSGDTGYGEIFTQLGKDYGPFNLSLIGIGAYQPRSIMHASHATPEEAVQIAQDLQAQNILGMHWGTITLTTEPPFEPPQRFQTAARAAGFTPQQIWQPPIGQTRPLPTALQE